MKNSYIRMLGSVLITNDNGSIHIARYVYWDGENFEYGYSEGNIENGLPCPCMPSHFWISGGSLHLGKTWKEVCERTGFTGTDNPFADVVFSDRASEQEGIN